MAILAAGRHRRPTTRSGLSTLERLLLLFTEIRPGEGATGVILLFSVFLLLAAYYFIKPARDGLLAVSPIQGLSETELKAYSGLAQSVVLLGLIPPYDRLSSALSRRQLITWVPLFFISNLILFWCFQPGLLFEHVGLVGIAFYIWVGIFNVFIVAQFWAFAADLYTEESGKRLFPMIAIGGTSGAVAGSWFSRRLVGLFGTYSLLSRRRRYSRSSP
jgi:AAA family ATP:ADP antiporter